MEEKRRIGRVWSDEASSGTERVSRIKYEAKRERRYCSWKYFYIGLS